MSENKSRVYYTCDICGHEIKNHSLNNTFFYYSGWQSGIHAGKTEGRGDVCNHCLTGNKLKGFLARLFVKFKRKEK